MNTNRGRKRRTEHERDSIREFNALVREHSEDALQNILRLSKYADDENIRLKASTWIAEKLVGRNYSVANEEKLIEHNNELTVHLVSVGNQHTLTQKEEQDIWKAEQGLEFTKPDDMEEWETDDNHSGNDVYEAEYILLKEQIKMERCELENTHAYRIYQNTHRGQYKGTETEVEKQERLVRTREYISKRITKVHRNASW